MHGRRLLVTSGCALVLLLAVSGLLLSTQPNPRAALGSLIGLPTATPTAPPPLGIGIFFVAYRVPWGVLTIDGKRNDALDVTQAQNGDPRDSSLSFLLANGRHTVAYDAPPFTPLRCVVTVPASAHDTCPLAAPDEQSRRYVIGVARILDLRATLAHLPVPEMAELVAVATAAIEVSTPAVTAHAGERYLGTDGQPHTFAQDAQATLYREPWTGTPPLGETDCHFLCPVSEGNAPAATWTIMAAIREGFHYAAAGSASSAPADGPLAMTPASYGQPGGPLLSALALAVSWDGAWHVTLDSFSARPLVCQGASTLLSNFAMGGDGASAPPQFRPMIPAANQADGCVVGIQLTNSDGTKGATGALLYRFGTLLTTDATSRSVFPKFLQADGAEQALAQQILAQAA